MVFAYWMLMTALSLLPYIGVVAVSVLIPALSVGFMAVSRAAERKQPIGVSLLFAGLREHVPAQLRLGAIYFLSIGLLLSATALGDGGALARWMLLGARPSVDVLGSEQFLAALSIAASLYLPVMMLFWFAPTLVAWHAMPAGKALFFSFFACLINWRAFTVYGLASGLVMVMIPFIVLSALMLTAGGRPHPVVMSLLFPFLLALLPTVFASFYVSYRDIFTEAAEIHPAAAGPSA